MDVSNNVPSFIITLPSVLQQPSSYKALGSHSSKNSMCLILLPHLPLSKTSPSRSHFHRLIHLPNTSTTDSNVAVLHLPTPTHPTATPTPAPMPLLTAASLSLDKTLTTQPPQFRVHLAFPATLPRPLNPQDSSPLRASFFRRYCSTRCGNGCPTYYPHPRHGSERCGR